MRINSFDWDEKNENHIAEHGVAVFEVEEAFYLVSLSIREVEKVNISLILLQKRGDISL